jgi:hypothetical protein
MRNKKEEKSERKERVLCEVNFPSESTSVFLFFRIFVEASTSDSVCQKNLKKLYLKQSQNCFESFSSHKTQLFFYSFKTNSEANKR